MKEKLTLTIDKEVKERAKITAKRRGVSVSKIVEQFLKSISEEKPDWKPREGSVVSNISGSVQFNEPGKNYSDIAIDVLIEKYGYEKSSD